MKNLKLLDHDDLLDLLQKQKYDEIIHICQDYIREKVEVYLKNFPYHYQYRKDYLHEVYIHILTKSLPSPAFLRACQEGNSFKFYLAKSVRNALNTLLNKEKKLHQNTLALESFNFNSEEESSQDKSMVFVDKTYKEQTDAQDILNQLMNQFGKFIENFKETLPRIAFKLILLLKIQARVSIKENDLRKCFPEITVFDLDRFWLELGSNEVYCQKEDKELYEMIYPYFQIYRKEKGTPEALQRWLNQYISGDKFQRGILDQLEIKDNEQVIKIQDKKMFADFLHVYFKNQVEEIPVETLEKTNKWTWAKLPSFNWAFIN